MFKRRNIHKACPVFDSEVSDLIAQTRREPRRGSLGSSRRGYTLIELLVVLAMIVLLTIFALPSYNLFRVNQEMKQKADEIKELIQQAYNMSQNPEAGVSSYNVIFDHLLNKVVLAKEMTADAQAEDQVLKPENFVKEIALNESQTLLCTIGSPSTSTFCGILVCSVKPQEQQESACALKDPGSSYLDTEDDVSLTTSSIRVNDSDAHKYFYWDGLDGQNNFEITGLKTNVNPIN